jgi:hypothetical protein
MRRKFTLVRLLVAAVLMSLPLLSQAQSTVVISQVYPGGGSGAAGTSYTRDYVELFNRSASAVAIGNWSIQYASATGTTVSGTLAIPAGVSIPAGGYYLIVTGSAGAAGVAVPGGDQVAATSGTPSLAAAGGKVFLANNTTTVTFGSGASFGNNLSANAVDAVGYGTGNAYEGTAAAPAPASNGAVLVRAASGCTDNNVNSTDFASATTAANAPRNSTTPLAVCGGPPSAAEINLQQGTTSYASGTTYSGFASTTLSGSNVKTFTIQNTGGTTLPVDSLKITGTNAANFAVSALSSASPVAANGSVTFTVTFTPSAVGTRTAVLTIYNGDSNEGSYVINLSGVGQAATPNPEIDVQVPAGTSIATAGSYSGFPSTAQGASAPAVTFTIANLSTTDALTLGTLTKSGTNAADFTITQPVSSSVAASGSTTFTVAFSPSATGTRTATISLVNDDQNENPYVINLSATATAPAPVLTSATPTSLLAGISSPVVLAGTTLGSSAVNFNGGTLTPSSNSSTSITVRITPPSAATFPVTVTNASGTSNALTVTATAPPTGFFEPFEATTQASYVTTPTAIAGLTTGTWTLNQGLITNSDAGDKKRNAQSVRLRGAGYIQMAADKTDGIGTVSFYAAAYNNDTSNVAPSSFTLRYSTDGGQNYTIVPGTPAPGSLTSAFRRYTYTLNVAGNVRISIGTTNTVSGTNPRLNIDDVQLTDFVAPADLTVSTADIIPAGTYNNITVTGTGEATLGGNVVVNGAFLVQTGGQLTTDCTNTITGSGSFTLAAGALLSICNPAGITLVGATGAIQVTGPRSFSSDASYQYNGTAAQVTGSGLPSEAYVLVAFNPAGVSLTNALGVKGSLGLAAGNFNTNNQLTQLSSASRTATVARLVGTISGSVTVQRYIDPSLNAGAGYRHYASPVVSTSFSDLTTAGFTPQLNTAYNTSATPGLITPFPTVFGYDESRIASTTSDQTPFSKGWFVPTGTLEQGRGYSVNIPASEKVDFVGALTFANVSKTLSRGASADAGWHLLGNPYAAPLDMSTVTIPAGINSAIYVFESTSQYGGAYRSYVNGVGGNPIVSVGQGFFVRATTNGATFPMTFANTTSDLNLVGDVFHRTATTTATAAPKPLVQLTLRNAANTLSDAAYVYFENGATAGFDARFDAEKLPNTHGLNLASTTGAEFLAINALPVLTAATIVPLTVYAPVAGSYVLQAAQLAQLPAGTVVVLRDALTGTRTVLTAGTSYRFTLAGTSATGRFALEFQPAAAPLATAAQALAAQVQLYPNPAASRFHLALPLGATTKPVMATLTNTLGQVVLTRTLTTAETDFDVRNLAAGVYNLRLRLDGTQVVRRVVVE